MKLNLRVAIPMLLGVAVMAACKKTDNAPQKDDNALNNQISAAIAQNMAKSLSGAYGGVNLNDGVSGPSKAANSISSSKLNVEATTKGCGFYTFNNPGTTYTQGDSVKATASGSINYSLFCTGTQTTGYNLTDSVATNGKGPGYAFNYLVVQRYEVTGLNTSNGNFTMNGTLVSNADFKYTSKPKSNLSTRNIYTFKDLYVHGDDSLDITSGSAMVRSTGTGTSGSWDITANLVYLGNHKAKLTFVNQVYLIDLTTGTAIKQ